MALACVLDFFLEFRVQRVTGFKGCRGSLYRARFRRARFRRLRVSRVRGTLNPEPWTLLVRLCLCLSGSLCFLCGLAWFFRSGLVGFGFDSLKDFLLMGGGFGSKTAGQFFWLAV